MKTFKVQSIKPKEIIDITTLVNEEIKIAQIQEGFCVLNLNHTSAALTTADLDPGTDLDLLDAFEGMIPKLNYRHPHDPGHVADHILSALIGTSLTLQIKENALVLGQWQNVVVVEFNGPRERQLTVGFIQDNKA